MKRDSTAVSLERIEKVFHMIRGQRIILDSDLANIYSVSTKALNHAVKRNAERFPDDFMFRVAAGERDEISSQMAKTANRSQVVTSSSKAAGLKSQFVTSNGRGGRRNLP